MGGEESGAGGGIEFWRFSFPATGELKVTTGEAEEEQEGNLSTCVCGLLTADGSVLEASSSPTFFTTSNLTEWSKSP